MRPQLIMACFGIFIIGTILSLIASGVWFDSTQVSIINKIASINGTTVQTLGSMNFAKSGIEWLDGIVTMVVWNYPYLDSAWGNVLKMIVLYPVSIGIIWAVIELFIQVIQGLAGMVRSLIP